VFSEVLKAHPPEQVDIQNKTGNTNQC